MRRRTLEEKLEAIRLVEAGNSPRSVSDRLHIGHHQIYPGSQEAGTERAIPQSFRQERGMTFTPSGRV